ncbi:MAG: fatty acid desaturase, partial [Pseudomonadota bacterium]
MRSVKIEWPTLLVAMGTYGLWIAATTVLSSFWLPLGIVVAAVAIAQYGSLTHEVCHGHPFKSPRANAALVAPSLPL